MKTAPLLTLGLLLSTITLAGTAYASEQVATTIVAPKESADAPVDCSKETWLNFSPSCLRNANQAIEVRLITASRR